MSALSKNVISRFAKLTANKDTGSKETTVYGTIKERDGSKYVLLDGAEILTPVTTTVEFRDGDRVSVLLKNHTATVTGNISSPSRNTSVSELEATVKDQAVVIDNNQVYRGTTAPKNPIPGTTLWIDFSVDPPLLKQYTADKKWEAVGTDKVQTSYIAIRNNRIDIKTGGILVIDTGAGVSIKSGGTFTVEAENLTINEEGIITANKAELKDATVNGTLLASGHPVLHTGNIVINSSAPANPTVGMVWISPNSVVQTEYYLDEFSDPKQLINMSLLGWLSGDVVYAPSGSCLYTLKVPLYLAFMDGEGPFYVRLITSKAPDQMYFPTQVYDSPGLTWYEQSVQIDGWWGDDAECKLYIQISTDPNFASGYEYTGANFQYGAGYQSSLTMICTPTDVSGWQNADVKYFAG